MIFADTVIDLPYSWTGYETILSLKLRREIYEDPFDGDTVVRGEQWEKFRNNTSYGFSFGSESFKGVPLAFAYR